MNTGDAGSLTPTLDWAAPDVRRILGRALGGVEVSLDDALTLARAILPSLPIRNFSKFQVMSPANLGLVSLDVRCL